ncbi:hypothetical protein ACMGD3_08080 [Lysinibacillus sphaericus]|uniref:hypothetical protein n=1 Tax=Lysinibacillus sphaericus TaxID=1421 RepID=UPI003F796054
MTNIHVCTAQEKQQSAMKICKHPRTEVGKQTKTRIVIESLVDQFLATGLIRNERLFNRILYNKEIIWIQNEGYDGHLFAKANVADELKTRKNGFMMYMPTNPIVYEVNGEAYHLITRIDSVRAKPNLERLHMDPKPILSAARVNDLLCSMVMRFYETYVADLALVIATKRESNKLSNLKKYVEHEYAQFMQAVKTLNDYHLNWHPRGNGHELLLQVIDNLQLLKSKPGTVLVDFSNNQGYVIVEPAYLLIEETNSTAQAL